MVPPGLLMDRGEGNVRSSACLSPKKTHGNKYIQCGCRQGGWTKARLRLLESALLCAYRNHPAGTQPHRQPTTLAVLEASLNILWKSLAWARTLHSAIHLLGELPDPFIFTSLSLLWKWVILQSLLKLPDFRGHRKAATDVNVLWKGESELTRRV